MLLKIASVIDKNQECNKTRFKPYDDNQNGNVTIPFFENINNSYCEAGRLIINESDIILFIKHINDVEVFYFSPKYTLNKQKRLITNLYQIFYNNKLYNVNPGYFLTL